MPLIDDLERRIHDLHGSLSFRPTLDRAAAIGELLAEAKREVGHGNFLEWCRRLPFSPRTCRTYIQIANWQATAGLTSASDNNLTIDRFLRVLRIADRRHVDPPPDYACPTPDGIEIKCADNRKFGFPKSIPTIVTDSPWSDRDGARDHFDWLGAFAFDHLEPGGLLVAQCGTATLPDRLDRLRRAGLTYVWTLAIVYPRGWSSFATFGGISTAWRPVLVFSKGKRRKISGISDVSMMPSDKPGDTHPWEQPVHPWLTWLERLTPAGSLVVDPFCGSGNIARACVRTGRRFLGVEIDAGHVRRAKQRVADEVESMQAKKTCTN